MEGEFPGPLGVGGLRNEGRHRMDQLHTPEELRKLSNLGHWVEGVIFGVVGLSALIEVATSIGGGGTRYVWPVFILFAGVFLPFYILLHHGLGKVGLVWRTTTADPQQRQHLIMAVLLFASGAVETLRVFRWVSDPGWAYVWPAALGVIGALFITHAQHGTHSAVVSSVRTHRVLGITILLAGVAKAVHEVMDSGWGFIWPLLMLCAAAQLLLYREPPGAYEIAGHASHGPHRSART